MPVVSEALDERSLDLVTEYCDMIQIGARNMQNYSLLRTVGRLRKPVLLKRGMAATVEELLMAAEYVLAEGNYQVVLCERGIRTFTDHTRNTLDLAAVVAVQRLSHLPIIVDPSHGTGKRHKVVPLARAAAAVGADGLMIEVHHRAVPGALRRLPGDPAGRAFGAHPAAAPTAAAHRPAHGATAQAERLAPPWSPLLLPLTLTAALAWLDPTTVRPGQKGVCITEWTGGERREIPVEVLGMLDAVGTGPHRRAGSPC